MGEKDHFPKKCLYK